LFSEANPDGLDGDRNPYIVQVCISEDVELANLLVNFECDVNVSSSTCWGTPLHVAAKVGNAELAGLLLSAGADPNATDEDGNTPLMVGLMNAPSEELFNILLIDADLDTKNEHGETALTIAVREDCVKEVRILIDNGAQRNEGGFQGNTPLLHACIQSNPIMLKLLLELKCDPSIPNEHGETAVHILAQQNKDVDMLRFLLENVNIDIERNNKYGHSPLCLATHHGVLEITKELLKAGANPNAKVDHYRTHVLDKAMAMRHMYVVCALLIAGATNYESTKGEIEALLEPVKDAVDFNLELTGPLTLKQLCRGAIRKQLGKTPHRKVAAMDCLPPRLQDYVALKELEALVDPNPPRDHREPWMLNQYSMVA
jgi:ankyrin repeat protein